MRSRHTTSVRLFSVLTALAAALAGAGASKAAAGPSDAAKLNALQGVWIGTRDAAPGARFVGTPPWAPAPQLTDWGKAEARKWSQGELPPGKSECDPYNPAWMMNGSGSFPLEIAAAGNHLVVAWEPAGLSRRIYADGRPHPKDLDPSWMGHSIGRWEGDTLVVDTVGLNGQAKPINGYGGLQNTLSGPGALAIQRLPYSDQLHFIERIRLIEGGAYLEDRMTVDDPKAYKQPFTTVRYWQRRPDIDFQEFVCNDNRRDDEGYAPRAPATGR